MPARPLLLLLLLPVVARADDLFRQRIAPILEARCVGCHDAKAKRGGLDLSTRAGLLAGGDEGKVVVPGQSAKSRLLQFVSGPKPKMPRTGPKLGDAEVALLRRWIDAGADWPAGQKLAAKAIAAEETWWSLRSLTRPALPVTKDRAWGRTPVDAFILRALESKGLRPSPEANRRTLFRRLSFDLVGLPPTPERMEAFERDTRPDAYERIVESLLASPAYGERWGRHWLDVAHYGDTHGYDKDKRRDNAWPYRDWVIGAFNADKPYRDFVRMQLAGDVLSPGSAEGVTAAGFVVAGPWDFVGQVELREGTVDKDKTRVLDRDDMVMSAAGSFLSATVGCARCHDHKFDPIPARDYYRFQAVFSGVTRGDRPIPGPASAEFTRLAESKSAFQARLVLLQGDARKARGPEVTRAGEKVEGLRKKIAAVVLPPTEASKTNGYHSHILPTPDHTRWVQVDLGAVVAIDEVWLTPARPVDFRDTPGFGFPARFRVEASDEPTFRAPRVVADHTSADFANPGDAPVIVEAKGAEARYVRVTATRLWKRDEDFIFALAELSVLAGGKNRAAGRPVASLDSIEAGLWGRKHLVDGFDSRVRLPDSGPYRERAKLQQELRGASSRRDELAQKAVPAKLRQEIAQVAARLASVESSMSRVPARPSVYSVVSIPPRPIRILKRGEVENPGALVTPGALSCVGVEFPDAKGDEGRRRLALADWIADDANVLTWRSIANRLWHYHFGRGIVDTPNDLGKMGGLPSHPELLDWLAAELRDGASIKQMHRRIVLGATYRQACRDDAAKARIDADNRLLWRANRQRLDAEGLRDAVLAASGRLDRRMGGPGYELFRFKDDHSPIYDHSSLEKIRDPATYRRTVYRFVVRSVPNPFLDCLDCADPNLATPVRNTTLTALQALALRNNPFMVRQAKHLAERLEGEASDLPGRVDRLFLLLFGRLPRSEERETVVDHARKHGLAAACRVLFNANEFVFVE
jgi:mono/diheme cytochrome c family protein